MAAGRAASSTHPKREALGAWPIYWPRVVRRGGVVVRSHAMHLEGGGQTARLVVQATKPSSVLKLAEAA